MKKFLSFLFSDESKKMIQQFIPNIKKNVASSNISFILKEVFSSSEMIAD